MSPRRLDSRRDARRGPALTAGRAVAGFALTCGVVLGSTFAASADPDAGIPTQADVDAAQSAVDGAAARIAELDATYAQSAVALHGIRLEAARLGEIANGAKWELAQRTRAAQDATRAADAAASEAAKAAFQDWLAQKYQSPDALNRAWGNVFWSMEYASFDEIGLSRLAPPRRRRRPNSAAPSPKAPRCPGSARSWLRNSPGSAGLHARSGGPGSTDWPPRRRRRPPRLRLPRPPPTPQARPPPTRRVRAPLRPSR